MMVYPKHFIHFGLALFLVVALATVMGACSTSPTLSSIAITPESPGNLTVGATQQFAATGTYSDDSTSDITSEVTWNSDNTSVATIDSTGLATGVAAGTADITASMSGLTSPQATLTVVPPMPTLSSIAITPESPGNLTVGATQQFAATGTYSDDSTNDITSEVTWNSGNTTVATIDSTGLATGVAAGTADITASMSGLTSPAVILKVS